MKFRTWSTLIGLGCLIVLTVTCPRVSHSQSILESIQESREYKAGVSLLRNGDHRLARRQFHSFLETYPESEYRSRAQFGLAEAHYFDNHHDTASRWYSRALTDGETLPDRLISSAYKRGLESSRRSGSDTAIRRLLDQLEIVNRDHYTKKVLREAVKSSRALGDFERALEWVETGANRFPSSSYWAYKKGEILAGIERFSMATNELRSISDTSTHHPDAQYLLGEIAFEKGNYDTADIHYRVLEDYPDQKQNAHYGLGWTAIRRNQYDTAVRHLRDVIELGDQLDTRASVDLARVFRRMDQADSAVGWYENAINLSDEPRQSSLRIEVADYLVNSDRLTDAIPYYEQAQSLELKGRKHLIRAYISDNHYDSALKLIDREQSSGRLSGPRWDRYRALSHFQQNRPDTALSIIQSTEAPSDTDLTNKIYKLHGRILFSEQRWQDARNIYDEWSTRTDSAEARYFKAILDERFGETEHAIRTWQSLSEEADEPWRSRSAFQLYRLYHERGDTRSMDRTLDRLDRDRLNQNLTEEWKLLQLETSIRENGYGEEEFQRSGSLLDDVRSSERLTLWYDVLISDSTPRQWWVDLLLPELNRNPGRLSDYIVPTLSNLRERGWPSLSLTHGDRLLEQSPSPPIRRSIILQQLTNLTATHREHELNRYIPERNSWSNWPPKQGLKLGEFIHRYYRSTHSPDQGLAAIVTLDNRITFNNSQQLTIDEWKAFFLIGLDQHEQALELLKPWESELSKAGQLNKGIAHYHLGDTDVSLGIIEDLRTRWDTPPVELYEYGFRNLRKNNQGRRLKEWSEEFRRKDYTDTRVVQLLMDNSRFWIQSDRVELALNTLRSLEGRRVVEREKIPVIYYQGLGHFNEEQYSDALEDLQRLKNNYELDRDWTFRVHQMMTELHLQRKQWRQAYEAWKTLDSLNRGGETGQRLLVSQGLKETPDLFSEFLRKMGQNYPEYLPGDEKLYWQGRLQQKNGATSEAIQTFRNYLDQDQTSRARDVRVRLANLYEQDDQPARALQQYTELWNSTENPRHLIGIAQQQKRLGRYQKSLASFQRALDKIPERSGWIHFQMALTHQQQNQNSEAINALKTSFERIDQSSDTNAWVPSARRMLLRLALNDDRIETAQQVLSRMKETNETNLFKAEILRRQGQSEQALDVIESLPSGDQFSDVRESYLKIASAVYFENGEYDRVIKTLPDTPTSSSQQITLLQSLLETNQPDRARTLYQSMDSTVKSDGAYHLGHYYLEASSETEAISFFRQTQRVEAIPEQSEAHINLGQDTRAYELLTDAFETRNNDELRPYLGTIISQFQNLTPQLKTWDESAGLLNQHWNLVEENQRDTYALIALRWSIEAGNKPLASNFQQRMNRTPTDHFTAIAERFSRRGWTDLLGDWIEGLPGESGDLERAVTFYRHRLRLADQPDTTFVSTIQQKISESTQANSIFGPRYQRLLADYYYQRDQFERAAIEYSKVMNLFEFNSEVPVARLGLARSYVSMDNHEKARELFTKLSETKDNKRIRKEAQQWLDEHLSE